MVRFSQQYSPCLLCHQAHQSTMTLCQWCLQQLPWLQTACPTCAQPLSKADLPCGTCLQKPSGFAQVLVPFHYDTPIRQLITAMKFRRQHHYALVLAQLMMPLLQQYYRHNSWPTMLVAIPLHSKRLRLRGYNQALELAKILAQQTGITLRYDLCTRIRHTTAQSQLKRSERQRNLHAAFVAEKSCPRHIAVIDDVITTGSTARAVATVLTARGAQCIDLWCVAKA